MKTQADDYRNPLLNARPAPKGRIEGAHSLVQSLNEGQALAAEGDLAWVLLPDGEAQDVPAGARVLVKGAAGRIHCFVFDEAGSMFGPLLAFVEPGASKAATQRPAIFRTVALYMIGIAVLIFFGVAILIGPELFFWSEKARLELIVTLTLGWIMACAVVIWSLRTRPSTKGKSFEIAPPRKEL